MEWSKKSISDDIKINCCRTFSFESGRTVAKAKVSEPPSHATTVPTRAEKVVNIELVNQEDKSVSLNDHEDRPQTSWIQMSRVTYFALIWTLPIRKLS